MCNLIANSKYLSNKAIREYIYINITDSYPPQCLTIITI